MAKRTRLSAQHRVDFRSPTGKASNYIEYFQDLVERVPGIVVILYLRVSGREQNRRGNLISQKEWCLRDIERLGVKVLVVFCDVASGWKNERDIFQQAVLAARETGAVLVAESTDRFIRSNDYLSTTPDVLPTVEEYEFLAEQTRGVQLATLLHPDSPWKDVRQHQIRRGQSAKDHKGGRPKKKKPGYKKQPRLQHMPKIPWMLLCGITRRQMAKYLAMPVMTIQDWIQKLK